MGSARTISSSLSLRPRKSDVIGAVSSNGTITSKDHDKKTVKSNVPVLIAGKELLNDLMAQLGSPFRERNNEREDPKKIIALSEIHYFKLRMEDLLNVINGSEPAKKTDFIQAGDSLIREFPPQ
ncbi:hypothetical protein GCK72_001282 [Caenorhabditis remanei]|uniref:Uncharacterized protein n=1 Tax=Caenorhabditis remanei TaxID=31234 RepID=A0A6A5HPA9_CAERE|nr:hypothetical protein GCK72_001282 [Caenorhabditis remanei]KAF1769465.1 hypothetical protein GCK72_001282 [Caenorhabditis remanei]